jgi:hypothetical protein
MSILIIWLAVVAAVVVPAALAVKLIPRHYFVDLAALLLPLREEE